MGRSKQPYVALEKLPEHIQAAFEKKALTSIDELVEALSFHNARKHQELEMLLCYAAGAFTRGNKSGSKLARTVANFFGQPTEQFFTRELFPQIPTETTLSVTGEVKTEENTVKTTLEFWNILIQLAGKVLTEPERAVFLRYFMVPPDNPYGHQTAGQWMRRNPDTLKLLKEAQKKIWDVARIEGYCLAVGKTENLLMFGTESGEVHAYPWSGEKPDA